MLIRDPLNDEFEKKATRDGYGDGLVALGEQYNDLLVLDADLSGSTKTKSFSKKFPERFYNFGVAEQNMVGHAAGLAMAGMRPVASSFAMFLTGRAWEIVRNSIAYPGLNVKLAASHAGITLGEDGASHQTVEDIALMRVIPGMKVLVPADYWQAYHAIAAAFESDGPVYIRLGRPKLPMIYDQSEKFKIGTAKKIQDGEKAAFIAMGVTVFEAWKAARIIENETGIKPAVYDFSTVKPIDSEALDYISENFSKIYTFEEHNTRAGLGSAVAEYVVQNRPVPVTMTGIDDTFGQSGSVNDLLEHYGLTAERIAGSLINDIKNL